MASISVTFISSQTGAQTANFDFTEDDMERILSVLRTSYQEAENNRYKLEVNELRMEYTSEQEEEYSVAVDEGRPETRLPPPPEPVKLTYTNKMVCRELSEAIIQQVIDTVHENERMIKYRELGIKPIEIKQDA